MVRKWKWSSLTNSDTTANNCTTDTGEKTKDSGTSNTSMTVNVGISRKIKLSREKHATKTCKATWQKKR